MGDEVKTAQAALYVVATPIGNLSDITFRAVETLKNVDIIAAEDTRVTSRLLEHYNISTRLISYHKFSENERASLFLDYLNSGKNVALVSDAGTPLISDPGEILVQKVMEAGFKVVPIVGATAVAALVCAIPRQKESFKFVGFLPRQKGQMQKIFKDNKYENLIFYESPNRIAATLSALIEVLPDAKIALGRELTKKFEEIQVASAKEIAQNLTQKGEFVCMVYAKDKTDDVFDLEDKIKCLKQEGFSTKDIAKILSALFDINKNIIKTKIIK